MAILSISMGRTVWGKRRELEKKRTQESLSQILTVDDSTMVKELEGIKEGKKQNKVLSCKPRKKSVSQVKYDYLCTIREVKFFDRGHWGFSKKARMEWCRIGYSQ